MRNGAMAIAYDPRPAVRQLDIKAIRRRTNNYLIKRYGATGETLSQFSQLGEQAVRNV